LKPTPKELIAKLQLEPHQEGGWFRQAYKSATQVQAPQGQRSAVTTIYWHFYHGAPAELFCYDPATRKLIRHRLDAVTGEGVQVAVIPAGSWQAAHCLGEYLLVGCTVSPGYEDADFRWVRELPDHKQHFAGEMRGLEAFL
jgi:predicted cupin superfamily sugar epimerase